MPLDIIRNDITLMAVDAIVNAANPEPLVGYGVDSLIHHKAGSAMLAERRRIGRIPVGKAAVTPGYALPAQYVIHAATPVWQGGYQEEATLLRSCYDHSLKLALKHRCSSVAFPLLSAGNHGFPKDLALQIATDAIGAFLRKHDMQVYLVVFSRDAFQLSRKLYQGVSSFIDEHYVLKTNLAEYGVSDKCQVRAQQQELVLKQQMLRRQQILREELFEASMSAPMEAERSCQGSAPAPRKAPAHMPPERKGFTLPFSKPKPTLAHLLAQTDAGFSETLLKLIDRTGKKDSEIYSKANISRQHFSKIRNNPDYKPTKSTAIAFAIALELDLEQTQDLIGRAGFKLTNSSKFDVIIMYFIEEHNYNIMDINTALFEFDQSLLGA